MQVDYIAKRSLNTDDSHIVDGQYSFDVEVSRLDRSFEPVGTEIRTLDGIAIPTVHRFDTKYRIETVIIADDDSPGNADLLEFLDSVSAKETFQLTIDGEQNDYTLGGNLSRPYRRTRIGSTDLFTYSFEAIQAQ